jgi:surfactin family lipopeptide synthetase A
MPLAKIDFLPLSERRLLLEEFNATKAGFETGITLVDMFNRQVQRKGTEVSLLFKDRSYTYDEIDKLSNQLGNYLLNNFIIEREDLVAVMLERSEWQIIALLAVIKTGAAYVPIDPSYPEDRINYLRTDSSCKVCIDQQELERFLAIKDTCPAESPGKQVSENDLVYVIYTSGSTGKPKGCMLEHGSVINYLEWFWRKYAFTGDDVILQKTTFTFDVSVWEIFIPLCWGCRMVLCEKEDIYDPERIVNLITRHNVTCAHFVPGMLTAFINAVFLSPEKTKALSTLNKVMASGEALPLATVKTWYGKMQAPLYNLYGPTEATVDVSYYDTTPEADYIPIGKPVANTSLYVLDDYQNIAPLGIAGEIYTGGIQVGRGYLNREELTRERFIDSPFHENERLYKTGDIGRWLPDGNVEFLGRIDDQVKIRGFRIELDEITHVIRKYDAIQDAVVLTRKGNTGDLELVCYFISPEMPDIKALKSFLGSLLPEYMVPGAYIRMDKFPITGSDKIDKKKLLEITTEDAAEGAEAQYVAPRNDVEAKLVEIWTEVIGTHRKVGMKDNFFEMGGHSIKAILLLSAVFREFGVMLEVQMLFEEPTIENMAEKIQNISWFSTGQGTADSGQEYETVRIV